MTHSAPLSKTEKWLVQLAVFGTLLGWGWCFVAIRDAVTSFSPGELALGRYMVASLTLLPVWLVRGCPLPQVRHLPVIIVMGLSGFSSYNIFLNLGEQHVTAGTAALIAASLPILITVGAFFFFKEPLSPLGWGGVALAFFGVFITTLGGKGGFSLSIGALLVFCAMISGTIYGLVTKKMLYFYAPLEITTWAVWAGFIGLIPFGLHLFPQMKHASAHANFILVMIGIVPGALCYVLYGYAISKIPMARIANVLFLIPITAIILGWLLLKELPSELAFIGGGTTIVGALLVQRTK